ncbi:MAG: PASTA domain-containing protein [Candidatus Omnitrophota bacterium]|nr:MAG: PASTA domain-containing protein [Candidatus Omnitrophota bacterium]
MGRLIRGLYRFIRAIIVGLSLLILLAVGMASGGFFLMDYLVSSEEVEVPNLMLKTKEEAIVLLAECGLMLRTPIDEFPSQEVRAGLVIEQRPYPNTFVKKGRRISITVSTGAEQVMVPDLAAQQEQEVPSMLRASGLNLGSRARAYHSVFPENTVIAQDPLPGPRILDGNKVDILVSLGPWPIEYIMPDCTGMSISAVLEQFISSPIKITEDNIQYQKTTDRAKWNRILAQNPRPGEKTPNGSHVQLTVGSSGREISEARLIHIGFPVPAEVFLSDRPPVLMVWDDAAVVFDEVRIIPLQIDLFTTEIDKWLPVFGNALVMLGIPEEGPYAVPKILHSQYFKAASAQ